MTPFQTRPATEDERGIAYDSWWRQMANLRPPQTPMGLWRRGCQDQVERVLRRSNVLVSTPTDNCDDVIGLVCYEGEILHFVYVKFHVRRWGIARGLLEKAVNGAEVVTFTTMPRRRLMGLVNEHWNFDPFAGTGLHFGSGPFQETRPS